MQAKCRARRKELAPSLQLTPLVTRKMAFAVHQLTHRPRLVFIECVTIQNSFKLFAKLVHQRVTTTLTDPLYFILALEIMVLPILVFPCLPFGFKCMERAVDDQGFTDIFRSSPVQSLIIGDQRLYNFELGLWFTMSGKLNKILEFDGEGHRGC